MWKLIIDGEPGIPTYTDRIKALDAMHYLRDEVPESEIKLITVEEAQAMEEAMQEPEEDAIKPGYYQFPGGLQASDIAQHLSFNAGSAVKYLCRACRIDGTMKADPLQDLEKAAEYIRLETIRLKKDHNVH